MIFGIENLPLMISTILINTNPFFVALLSQYFLREKIGKLHVFCLTGCFIGVILLSTNKEETHKKDLTPLNYTFGVVGGLVCAMTSSVVFVMTRIVKEIHFSIMIYQYASVATVMFILYALGDFLRNETQTYPSLIYLDKVQWFYIAVISTINTVSQFYATLAF